LSVTGAITANGGVNVATGQTYKINGTDVLSGSTLGAGVTASSLTSVGTLSSLTVTGAITANGGVNVATGQTYKINGVTVLSNTGSIINTKYIASGTRTTVNSTSFVEASTSYRVSITPSSASNYIILKYFIPNNTNGDANTIYSVRAWREINGGTRSYSLTSAGTDNGSRNVFAGITFRPNNGFDSNDPGSQNFIVVDAPNTTSACVYGFEVKRESGGAGTIYFGYSNTDTSNFGFDSDIVIVAQEIVA
jgi:hypothetical protein